MHHCVIPSMGIIPSLFLQVHNLDPNTWKSVEVVHIDIADRTQVEPGVSKCPLVGQGCSMQLIPLVLGVGSE